MHEVNYNKKAWRKNGGNMFHTIAALLHCIQQAQSGEGDPEVCQSTSRLCLLNMSVKLRTDDLGLSGGSSWILKDWIPYWLVIASAAEEDLCDSIEFSTSTACAWHDFPSSIIVVWMVCIEVRPSSPLTRWTLRCSHCSKLALMASTVNENPGKINVRRLASTSVQSAIDFHVFYCLWSHALPGMMLSTTSKRGRATCLMNPIWTSSCDSLPRSLIGITGKPNSRSRSPWFENSSTRTSAHLRPCLNGRDWAKYNQLGVINTVTCSRW